MPPELYVLCPKCGHEYNVHQHVFDRGPEAKMFCPMCMAEFPRREAKLAASGPQAAGGSESEQ
ncbi:MAG: hypothetical protein KGJ86_05755 [Chloroflexota bacterium]|nr:hypothetical protein [Chloroflexota bacterium]